MPSIPAGTRTAMRAQAMPGEDPETLPHPSDIAGKMLPLASPALTETGLIYQAKHDRFVALPAAGIIRLVASLSEDCSRAVRPVSMMRDASRSASG